LIRAIGGCDFLSNKLIIGVVLIVLGAVLLGVAIARFSATLAIAYAATLIFWLGVGCVGTDSSGKGNRR
jgi:uncharacterized membrane protein SirB2